MLLPCCAIDIRLRFNIIIKNNAVKSKISKEVYMSALTTVFKKGITSSQLKNFAILFMLIDHIAYVIIYYLYYIPALQAHNAGEPIPATALALLNLYYIMRYIGRIAFPLFCFMIVQGFIYTRSRKKYLLRLVIFAFISEIPFNLANLGTAFTLEYQNVFFTLSLGLLCIIILDYLINRLGGRGTKDMVLLVIICAAVTAGFSWFGDFIRSDYYWEGVLTIVILYFFRSKPVLGMTIACAVLTLSTLSMGLFEVFCFGSIPFIALYNGQKGHSRLGKFFFYAFYPAHLFILWAISEMILRFYGY